MPTYTRVAAWSTWRPPLPAAPPSLSLSLRPLNMAVFRLSIYPTRSLLACACGDRPITSPQARLNATHGHVVQTHSAEDDALVPGAASGLRSKGASGPGRPSALQGGFLSPPPCAPKVPNLTRTPAPAGSGYPPPVDMYGDPLEAPRSSDYSRWSPPSSLPSNRRPWGRSEHGHTPWAQFRPHRAAAGPRESAASERRESEAPSRPRSPPPSSAQDWPLCRQRRLWQERARAAVGASPAPGGRRHRRRRHRRRRRLAPRAARGCTARTRGRRRLKVTEGDETHRRGGGRAGRVFERVGERCCAPLSHLFRLACA